MKERISFSFLTFKVTIELRDTAPSEWAETAVGGCYDEPDKDRTFRMWFLMKNEDDYSLPSLKIIAHECWHLFMTIMNHVDKWEHTFEELNNEIYAYNFHMLFSMVLDSILDSKSYRKMAEEKEN